MSFKRVQLFPANPNTTRGESTKISARENKVVYANGRSIIIRDLDNETNTIAYAGHVQPTTVARISPSGYYCASADQTGQVRVWDIVGEDQSLKGEYKVISGKINDLEWDSESKRIVAAGNGREKFAHAFMADGGSSTGEIGGHAKPINAVSIRHQRPFRAVTASDDGSLVFHNGVPWRYSKTIKSHTNFVHDVRYARSGALFASVGADAKVFLYDGGEGETKGELTDGAKGAHAGTIYACAWSPDDKTLVTASADRTVKLWNVETSKATTTYTLGEGLPHQQVGGTWATAGPVTLSVSGSLNLFDPRSGGKPARVLEAPQKSVTAAAPTGPSTFIVGDAGGRALSYDTTGTGSVEPLAGTGHGTLVSGLAASSGGKAVSVGFDDRIREIEGARFTNAETSIGAQPRGVALSGDGTAFVPHVNGVEAVRENQKVFELSAKFTPSVVAASDSLVAVGGEDMKVRLHDWDGKALKEVGVLEGNKGVVSAIAISPDRTLLAAGDSSGKVVLYNVPERKLITSRWSFHSARINALAFTADGQHCVSGALDTHIYVWSVQKPMKNIALKNAVPGGVNAVWWLGEGKTTGGKGTCAGAGADGCVRVWEVTFHA